MSDQNIGNFLIQRLYDYGARHVFGVPGDFVLGFYQQMIQSNKLRVINTCDEQCAGFAADAYARINGLGVVCVTYCVGGLKVVNATAQAFAEKSPVVVVSGAPGVKERRKNPLLHHKVKDFDTQQKIFEHITVESVVLEDPKTAVENIEKALSSARRYRRPVYIELPRDTILSPIPIDGDPDINFQTPSKNFKTDTDTLQEALEEAISMINSSKQPVIVAGVEVQSFGLQDELLRFIDKTNIPVVSTVLSKSTDK